MTPLSRLRRLPPQVDDALTAGRPLLGVPRAGGRQYLRLVACPSAVKN